MDASQSLHVNSDSIGRRVSKAASGMTLLEVMVVVVICFVLFVLLMPLDHHHDKVIARRLVCKSNLRQIAVAEALWGVDNGKRFCATVSTNAGGSLEFLNAGQVAAHLEILNAYLKSFAPRVYHCPTDSRQISNATRLKDDEISYFVSQDANFGLSNSCLIGDRNLTLKGRDAQAGMLPLSSGSKVVWTKEMHSQKSGERNGVVAFPDGHGEIILEKNMTLLTQLGSQTNRLVFP
jgi:hypothetical protein